MPEAFRASPAMRYCRSHQHEHKALKELQLTLKNKVLFSTAAPTRGALIPLYIPRNPSCCMDFLKQSKGPVYRSGIVSGCDCRRTLTVSKGYSIYLPTMPAVDPHRTSLRASSPLLVVCAAAGPRASSIRIVLGSPPLPPNTATELLCASINLRYVWRI
jgi:hypothetical protein